MKTRLCSYTCTYPDIEAVMHREREAVLLNCNWTSSNEDNIHEKQPFLHYLQHLEYTKTMSAWLISPPLPSLPFLPPFSTTINPLASHPQPHWVIHRVYQGLSRVSIITLQCSGAEGSQREHSVQQIPLSTLLSHWCMIFVLICTSLMHFSIDMHTYRAREQL